MDDLLHIGDKVLSRERLLRTIDEILGLRQAGFSQQATAERFSVDRSFVSRLETIAEVHKGGRIGLVGFPVANKEAVRHLAEDYGVEFMLLLSEDERQTYLNARSGMELLHEVLGTVARLRTLDHVILLASDRWFSIANGLLGREVSGIRIGTSPIAEDREVSTAALSDLLQSLGGAARGRSGGPEETLPSR
ncbi:MAG: transcriptional regulator [Thermaerobacter sp.]|nr:transcriptional regulator [Thermaerobacter sp.]